MYGQISLDTILLLMLYGIGAAVAGVACFYLLLRRANAFAPDVTPPVRLRRWTAAFFAILAMGHLWYLPAEAFTSGDNFMMWMLVGGLLDSLTLVPLPVVLLLCMLQDRRRPLWPVGVLTAPLVVLMVAGIATRSMDYLPLAYDYLLLMTIGLVVYMVRAVRQYGRWLRDNFADLEHKEVWQTFVVLVVIVLALSYYVAGYDGSMTYAYVCQVCSLVVVGHLLWRVETLSDLSIGIQEDMQTGRLEGEGEALSSGALSDATYERIGALLMEHCEGTRLYLQHDLTISQLAQAIGTNRTYLSHYFSSQQTTYNSYINTLRISYFIKIYHEAVASQQPFTVQQLSVLSGYHSYSTFCMAFKQCMGQTVSAWMRT